MGNREILKNAIFQQIRVLYRPRDTYRALKDAPFSHIAISFGILLLITCILMAIPHILPRGGGGTGLMVIPFILFTLGTTILTLLLWGTVMVSIAASFLHIPVLLLGGRNGFIRTLMVVMYGSTPILLTIWIYPILTVFGSEEGIGIVIGCFLLVTAWSILLIARGLREVQEVSSTRSTVVAGVGVVVIFIVFACIVYFFMSLPPDAPIPQYPPVSYLRINAERLHDHLIVINHGWTGTPRFSVARLEVLRDGIGQGYLGLEPNSTLLVDAPSCPVEVSVEAYDENDTKRNVKQYHDISCDNSFVNLRIIRHQDSIEVVNNGGPRIDEILELLINITDVGTFTLGSEPKSSVTVPVPDRVINLMVTAHLTNGASWRVTTLNIRAYREAGYSHTYDIFVDVTPAPPEVCAKAGDAIGAVGLPTHCCEGLDPLGGWPGGYTGSCLLSPPPGGLFICSDCGDGICTNSTGENTCNCGADCS